MNTYGQVQTGKYDSRYFQGKLKVNIQSILKMPLALPFTQNNCISLSKTFHSLVFIEGL
jgi:hypothetical protein